MTGHPRISPLFPPPPLSRSDVERAVARADRHVRERDAYRVRADSKERSVAERDVTGVAADDVPRRCERGVHQREDEEVLDRKSTRLNSSHLVISYAVFCLKK